MLTSSKAISAVWVSVVVLLPVQRSLMVSFAYVLRSKIASSHGAVEEVCCCPEMVQSVVQEVPVEIWRFRPAISAPYMWYQKDNCGVSKGAKSMAGLVKIVLVPLVNVDVSVYMYLPPAAGVWSPLGPVLKAGKAGGPGAQK